MDKLIFNNLDSLHTLVLILIIVAMLYVLSKGADILVNEAVALSLHIGVPKVIIGATIVSLGTTLPEATVSVLAAINGNPDLALGNAIGSIIVDTGLILGLSALVGRLPVDRVVVSRQGKIQVWAVILLAVVSLPFLTSSEGNIRQWIGFLFLILLIIYIAKSIRWGKQANLDASESVPGEISAADNIKIEKKATIVVQLLKLAAGIFLIITSSKILIPSVEISAVRVGIPQSIIAATLIAFGTSLPELVTALTAVRKGHGELAIGNIVGADILNVLFVVGGAAAVTTEGLHVPSDFYKLQIPALLIIILTFRFFSKGKMAEISKKEGFILLFLYLIYLTLNYTWL